jgi:hypothetical protein
MRAKEEIAENLFRGYLTKDKKKIKRALVEFVVENRLSFNIVENSSLGTLLTCFNPLAGEVLPTSHNTISDHMMREFENQKGLLQRLLKSSYTRIHISADIWTSPNRYLTLGVTGTFVWIDNDKPRRIRALLGLQEVAGHSGENQSHLITPILEQFDIIQNIGCVVGDNATTNDTLCRSLASHFNSLKTTHKWVAEEMRGRCLGHLINLIAKAFLVNKEILQDKEEDNELIWVTITAATYEETRSQEKEKKKKTGRKDKDTPKLEPIAVLAKLHAIVIHIHNSPGHTKEFRELAGRLIPQDNATRWNSWYAMIRIACGKQEAVSKYTLNNLSELQASFLTDENWKELHAIKDFLKIFHEATLRAEGDHGSIGQTLVLLNALGECVSEEMVSNKYYSFLLT